MKLVLHHFWKDVRLMRWLLGFWLLIVGFYIALGYLSLQSGLGASDDARPQNAYSVLTLLGGIVWILLLVRLIQNEPVTGTTSFWRTRPIPPLVLVGSKLLFLALLAVLPALVMHRAELAFFQVEPEGVKDVMQAILGLTLLMALLVVWLATYTRNLAHFWITVCAILLGLFLTRSTMETSFGPAPALSAKLGSLLFLGGLTASLVLQYGFHRTRLAFWLGVGAVSTCYVSGFISLYTLNITPTPRTDHRAESRIGYRVDPKRRIAWAGTNSLDRVSYDALLVPLEAPSIDDRGIPLIEWGAGEIYPESGAAIPGRSSWGGGDFTYLVNWAPFLQKTNSDLTVFGNDFQNPAQKNLQLLFSPQRAAPIKNRRGRLDLYFGGTFKSLRRCAEIPLGGEGWTHIPNLVLRISSVNQTAGNFGLHVEGNGFSYGATPLVVLFVDARARLGIAAQPAGGGSSTETFMGSNKWVRTWFDRDFDCQLLALPAAVRAQVQASAIEDWTVEIYEITTTGAFRSDLSVPDVQF